MTTSSSLQPRAWLRPAWWAGSRRAARRILRRLRNGRQWQAGQRRGCPMGPVLLPSCTSMSLADFGRCVRGLVGRTTRPERPSSPPTTRAENYKIAVVVKAESGGQSSAQLTRLPAWRSPHLAGQQPAEMSEPGPSLRGMTWGTRLPLACAIKPASVAEVSGWTVRDHILCIDEDETVLVSLRWQLARARRTSASLIRPSALTPPLPGRSTCRPRGIGCRWCWWGTGRGSFGAGGPGAAATGTATARAASDAGGTAAGAWLGTA